MGEGAPGAESLADVFGGPRADGAVAPHASDARNPYKGLRSFAEPDAGDFFGRTELIERLVARCNETGPGARFLAVVGPSGSGKSSVVRAGLVPAIRSGALSRADGFVVAEMFPGDRPMEELEAAILRVAAHPMPNLRDRLEAGSRGLLESAGDALPIDTEGLLVVDQFEELFTLTRDERERELFLESLRVVAADPASRLRVVVTLRADFYDRPLVYPRFGELLGSRTEAVPPLAPDELEQAIRRPAERVGVRPDPGLVAEMIADVAHQPGALPLLQYALTELFERRDGDRLGLEAYTAIGGVSGALSVRAERLHEASGPDGRRAIRQVMLRLVTLGEGRQDTRRRVARSELDALEVEPGVIEGVFEAFGRHRLFTFDREPATREPTIEIAHEALLGSWSRLRGWIDDAREDLRFERQVSGASAEWRASDRDPSFLLRGARLDQAETWRERTDLAIGAAERAYLKASVEHRGREQAQEAERLERESRFEQRSRSRLRTLVAVLSAAALIASGLTVVALSQSARAEREARMATARGLASAAVASLDEDPELTILLALEALGATAQDGVVLPEAEEALHRGVDADRLVSTVHHPSTANVAWSSDGRFFVTGGTTSGREDGNDAIVWDAVTGEVLRTLSGHTVDVWSVAIAPDGSRLVTTGADARAIVWDTRTGEQLLDLGIDEGTFGASFSPDGERLVVGSIGGQVRILDTRSGEELESLRGGPFCEPMFSPDGARVAAAACSQETGADGAVWNSTTGRRTLPLAFRDPHGVYGVVFSPDGTRLAIRDGGLVHVIDSVTREELVTLAGHAGGVLGVAFSRDGSRLATGGTDGTARIWNASSGAQLLQLEGHEGTVALVDFSPDGTRLLTGGSDGTARVWDVTPLGPSERWSAVATEGGVARADFSPDGSRLFTASERGGWMWASTTGERLHSLLVAYLDVAIASDGTTAASSTQGAFLLDPRSGAVIRTFDVSGWVPSVAVSPDGSLVAAGLGTGEVVDLGLRDGPDRQEARRPIGARSGSPWARVQRRRQFDRHDEPRRSGPRVAGGFG